MKALQDLLRKSLFTSREARSLGIHPANLSYYVKTGQLKRISRGVYQCTAYNQEVASIRWGDLIEAVYSIQGGVICLTSALAIYDLTEEIPRQHWIAINHGTSSGAKDQVKIVRFRNMRLGRTQIELDGIMVPIFDRERTIIDAFRLLSRETAIKALKLALSLPKDKKIDLIKLQAYAKKLRVNIAPYLITATT
jgi:predicted transcriptional regulator of viral defense system